MSKEVLPRKWSIVAWVTLVGIVVLGHGLGGRVEAQGRTYWLTAPNFTGAEALTACPSGHMASMFEILAPSTVEYDTKLGVTQPDSGNGPPADLWGWIRTGSPASSPGSGATPGVANCAVWTISTWPTNATAWGTVVRLRSMWDESISPTLRGLFTPWESGIMTCDNKLGVWCVD
jgi:hypothetical protein